MLVRRWLAAWYVYARIVSSCLVSFSPRVRLRSILSTRSSSSFRFMAGSFALRSYQRKRVVVSVCRLKQVSIARGTAAVLAVDVGVGAGGERYDFVVVLLSNLGLDDRQALSSLADLRGRGECSRPARL